MQRKFIAIFIFFLIFLLSFPLSAWAAFFEFDRETLSVQSGENFSVQVMVDTEDDNVSGAEAFVEYDGDLLEVSTVVGGDFFDNVVYQTYPDYIYIAGTADDLETGKTGTGELATITFTAKSAGSVTLKVRCDQTSQNTSSIVKQTASGSEEVINCQSNKTLAITITGSSSNSGSSSSSENSTSSEDGDGELKELPKAGNFDNSVKIFLYGALFLGLAGASRFFLKES